MRTIENLGRMIKERRRQLDASQSHVASLAKISVNTLSQIERGEANPTVRLLEAIGNVLGMELTLQVKKSQDSA